MAIDLTTPLSSVTDRLRDLNLQFAGATLVLLKKGSTSNAWERLATISEGWSLKTIKYPQTGVREEVLTIYGTAAAEAVITGTWPAFDIIRADNSFVRYSKVSPLEVSGMAHKWRFLVRPNKEDRTQTPPAGP